MTTQVPEPEGTVAPEAKPSCIDAQNRGPYDGAMTEYRFGNGSKYTTGQVEPVLISALTYLRALRQFRVGTLFPERHAGPDGRIPVYASVSSYRRDDVLLTTVPVEAEAAEGLDDLRHVASLASAVPEGTLNEGSTAVAPATASTGLLSLTRREMEEQSSRIARMQADLVAQQAALTEQARALSAELGRRREQLWILELFLGTKEWVKTLREGAPAPAETPIAVRQRVLCMDEELAAFDWLEHPENIGQFDCTCLADFDARLVRDPRFLDELCPWPKGVVGLRIRREWKDRGTAETLAAAWENAELAEADTMTYLLVRNGEQLYRIWVDVNLWPRLFSSARDAAEAANAVLDEHGRELWASDVERAQARLKQQTAGLIAIQGMIERSTILDPLPRPKQRFSVFDPDCEDHFLLVRDDEPVLGITDGSNLAEVTWETVWMALPQAQGARLGDRTEYVTLRVGYKDWLEAQLVPGVRAQWEGRIASGYNRDDWAWTLEGRTGIKSLCSGPDRDEVYTLVEPDEDARSASTYKRWFYYLPRDKVYARDQDDWDGRDRKRRVLFKASTDELTPVDFLSWRVFAFLIRDRAQRAHYGDFLKRAFRFYALAKREALREEPFRRLVLSRCSVDPDDPANEAEVARLERVVRWWKMKTKEHRTLATDEAKALRMIEAAFRAGQDFDNDPERLLYKDTQPRTYGAP